ncbi:MAG: hypothetical protein ABIN48_08990 [Ginsengibacter sp.]
MSQTLFEKLQLGDEKNLLIQGLPSTIEKQFAKLSFSKNVTQLLRSRKIDFALIFALNSNQLRNIFAEVCPALHDDTILWIAFPRQTSKIASDLNRPGSWTFMEEQGFETGEKVVMDYVWSAQRFYRSDVCEEVVESHETNIKTKSEKLAEA